MSLKLSLFGMHGDATDQAVEVPDHNALNYATSALAPCIPTVAFEPAPPDAHDEASADLAYCTVHGFCRIKGCEASGGFEVQNAEGGCRSFHKHLLRDMRNFIDPVLYSIVDGSSGGSARLKDVCWLAVAACLLQEGKEWTMRSRKDSRAKCDISKFCSSSYAYVRGEVGKRLFWRDSSGCRPSNGDFVEMPPPSYIIKHVHDTSMASLACRMAPILKGLESSPILISIDGLASVVRRQAEIIQIRINADLLTSRLQQSLESLATIEQKRLDSSLQCSLVPCNLCECATKPIDVVPATVLPSLDDWLTSLDFFNYDSDLVELSMRPDLLLDDLR